MAYYGGNWTNAGICGLFCLNVNNTASNSNTNISGRLANDYRQKTASLRAAVQCISFGAIVLTMLSKMNGALRLVAGYPANVAAPFFFFMDRNAQDNKRPVGRGGRFRQFVPRLPVSQER
ncbi:hypothetical protein [Eoetvoesiella caeni]